MKNILFLTLISFFWLLSPLYGESARRSPIDINLIIDGSGAISGVREDVNAWIFDRLDLMLVSGDRVNVWSAGTAARLVHSGAINNDADRDALKRSIRDFAVSGDNPDFSGALREAAARPVQGYCYTLLIYIAPASVSNILSGPQAGLLRFSKIDEYSGWRALTIGLNLNARVQRAAAAFFGP